jgi:hypothetical protein
MVDAVIWDDLGWFIAMWEWLTGERPPMTSTRTRRYFEKQGWRDIEDAFAAAAISRAQATAFTLYLANPDHPDYRSIAEAMGISTNAAKLQVGRAKEKFRLVCPPPDDTLSD